MTSSPAVGNRFGALEHWDLPCCESNSRYLMGLTTLNSLVMLVAANL